MSKESSEIKTKAKEPDYVGHRQRLKTRFLADLGHSMPDYELLELLLMLSIPRRDVKPLAKRLLEHYGNLAGVLAASPDELMKVGGVGANSTFVCSLVHACTTRICGENLNSKDIPIITSIQKVVEYCRTRIGYGGQEQLLVIYSDVHGRYLKDSIEQAGTIDNVMISPRDIVEKALLYKASRIVIAHNHPSGECTPSTADIEMTKKLKEALKTVSIALDDHIIISPRSYYSMRERLPFMNVW